MMPACLLFTIIIEVLLDPSYIVFSPSDLLELVAMILLDLAARKA